jgi:hypothetical protein
MKKSGNCFGDKCKLLVPVVHDDLERFHYPGEEIIFLCYLGERVRCSAGHDTLELDSDQIEFLED